MGSTPLLIMLCRAVTTLEVESREFKLTTASARS